MKKSHHCISRYITLLFYGIFCFSPLCQADAKDITEAQLIETTVSGMFPIHWHPAVDKDFVPREPLDMLREGDFAHVPTIIGTNKDEVRF